MTDAWFSIIDIDDEKIQACLDAIILLANPGEKLGAHITLGGPYTSEPQVSELDRAVRGSIIHVVGVGKFFNRNQNTVFLNCGSEIIRKSWRKKDYGFNPHMTIYDGSSRSEANNIFNALNGHRFYCSFTAGRVKTFQSIKGQRSMQISFSADFELIGRYLGYTASPEIIRALPAWKRLMLIDRLCVWLTYLAAQRDRIGLGTERWEPEKSRKLGDGAVLAARRQDD